MSTNWRPSLPCTIVFRGGPVAGTVTLDLISTLNAPKVVRSKVGSFMDPVLAYHIEHKTISTVEYIWR